MAFDLVQIRLRAEEKEYKNDKFRLFLKSKCHLKSEEIDERVFASIRRCGPESIVPNAPTAAGKCTQLSPKRKSTGWRAVSP